MTTLEPSGDDTLLLDLLNSTPVVDGIPTDTLGDDARAADWARSRGGTGSAAETDELRRTRHALQAVVRAERPAASLEPFLRRVRLRPALAAGGLTWLLEVADDRRLASRAVLAWARIDARTPSRLRPCANDECRLFLLDQSKANNARWCSMAVCGNRMKARRHYRRGRPDPER